MNAGHKSIEKRFSAAAGLYDRHAAVQTDVAREVMRNAAGQKAVRRILEIGCGTGILTGMLTETYPAATISALDISPGMIEHAKVRIAGAIEWIVGDFAELELAGGFDLITGSSSLHWIRPHDRTFMKVRQLLAEGGRFVFGMMVQGTMAELQQARAHSAPGKEARIRMAAEEDVLDDLRAAGFDIVLRRRDSRRIVLPSAADLLRQLHEQGVTGGMFSSGRGGLTRGELGRLVAWYDSNFRCEGGIFATYEILYVAAEGGNR